MNIFMQFAWIVQKWLETRQRKTWPWRQFSGKQLDRWLGLEGHEPLTKAEEKLQQQDQWLTLSNFPSSNISEVVPHLYLIIINIFKNKNN